jgi:hypothetical protein
MASGSSSAHSSTRRAGNSNAVTHQAQVTPTTHTPTSTTAISASVVPM